MKTIHKKMRISVHPKGQALLVVLVISTLTLLLLFGVVARIDAGRTAVRRSSEFDRAVAASDNALNQVVKILQSGSCSLAFSSVEYTELEKSKCAALNQLEDEVQVFGKQSDDKKIDTSPSSPISLFLGDTTSQPISSTGVRVTCENASSTYRFIVTRVYQDPIDKSFKVDKGLTDCAAAQATSNPQLYPKGNVDLYGTDAGTLKNVSNLGIARGDTKLVRVRPLDLSTATPNKISIELISTSAGSSQVVASTGKYDFIIIGAGGLGSDAAVKFQKPRSDYTLPAAFDFVYFGDESP